MAKELILRGTPSDRQIEFFEATVRRVGYGGARGGGKSWAMRRKFVLLALSYSGLKLLLMRRTFAELEGNHIVPLLEELNGFAKYSAEKRVFVFPNGSRIKLGYCDSDADVMQYQGQEYEVIGFEEATQFTEYQMTTIAACNRTTRSDFKPRIYYTMNPGGPGHDYMKRLFIDRIYKTDKHGQPVEKPEDYLFIPAKVYDNRALMESNPEYIDNLRELPERLREAYLNGDWDVIEGQFFSEFDREKHVVEPFRVESDWTKFRAIDWGFNDPCCVLWLAVAPDQYIYVYREVYMKQVLAGDMARLICKLSERESISYTVASPDMWQRRGTADVMGGENIAETFMHNGVCLIRADNSRENGWQRVRENLALTADGTPHLQIFNTCTNLIRTLPLLPTSKKNSNDVADGCDDHAPEALRYGLMSRPSYIAPKQANRRARRKMDPFYEKKPVLANGYLNLEL